MLQELDSPDAVATLIRTKPNVVVTFSAHWCGPCKASKPKLEALAAKYEADSTMDLDMAIVYEDVLGEDIHAYAVRAFPTYVLFQRGTETSRVEGANFPALEEMIQKGNCTSPLSGGETLGGGSVATTPAEARAARLAKLGGGTSEPMDTSEDDVAGKPSAAEGDTKRKAKDDDPMEEDDKPSTTDAGEAAAKEDPTEKLDPELIKQLTESMGFPLVRAQKGLLYGPGTVEGAVDWLMEHQDDEDIDHPVPMGPLQKMQSYKCNDCGKVLSNMANLELHANKTGHSDFEESTEAVVPLTEEEKKAKIAEIKELLRLKRAEREESEKVDDVTREKQRRNMGKEMAKTREQMEIEARKREALVRKREKEAFRKERERLRAELAKDKAERAARGGKLQSRLGAEGYKPDGIQYDVPTDGGAAVENNVGSPAKPTKKFKADASKIDDYIKKVSSYRAGGDGGKCLKILKTYVSNVVDNPNEPKFKTIKTDNNAFKTKVKPFIGGKLLLLAVGFKPTDDGNFLVLSDEDTDQQLLADTKSKLEAALVAYG